MSYIDYMRIHRVDLDSGDDGGFDVYADDLEFTYSDRYSKTLNCDEYFDLGCEYLMDRVEGVVSTDYAKIDYFTTHD